METEKKEENHDNDDDIDNNNEWQNCNNSVIIQLPLDL